MFHTSEPPVSAHSATNAITIACHGASISEYAIRSSVAKANIANMKAVCRRGSGTCESTSDARIAPTPPAAKTRPRLRESPPRSFLIR